LTTAAVPASHRSTSAAVPLLLASHGERRRHSSAPPVPRRAPQCHPRGYPPPTARHGSIGAPSYLQGPDCVFRELIAFFILTGIRLLFYFVFRYLIAFPFYIQGSMCKIFDSQLMQATKQHLSPACFNKPRLPNIGENLNTTCLRSTCMREDRDSQVNRATKHTLKSYASFNSTVLPCCI
jgi:hypothetical protein